MVIDNNTSPELGFGKKKYDRSVRFINPDGTVNIRRKTGGWLGGIDVYHWLINTNFTRLAAVIVISYVLVNLIFATLYFHMGVDSFGGIPPGKELDHFISLFFFSAQTLTTVGYGHIYPLSHLASLVAAIESMAGLLGFAIATGLLYGRFSRPRADLLHSNQVLISPYEGHTALMFRIGNKKQYELIESEASVTMSYLDPDTGKREFVQLKLEINKINYLALSWTIVHPITEESPIHRWVKKDFIDKDVEILVLIKAINDTFSQNVYSRISYKGKDVVEGAKFVPLKQEADKRGRITVQMEDIHEYQMV